ncbi:AAA family ATPase [Rhizobium sp. P40RR-XXII]|uniref:ATP-binding protein n=1 Tax=unclassified Rhizobium TaxID=2613769 RepID=UPI001456BBF2|nr:MULTISPECIES: AAA family ATPase [unclassified Rhizobium]NLR86466.1 AAA family ATPase [Rhizobium sp. P28RR-XV]NLS21364.1 AAA family ATPase [Rhizobium sp. P40RR-XXII]
MNIDHRGEILILTGTPGAGKTTTASALAALSGSSKVHLHSDDFWHFIKHGAIKPYLPEAHSQNKVVLDVLANVAATYAKGGYFVIVDGIIGPWFLAAFEAISFPIHYIVLRPRLETAIERCRNRGGDTLSDPEPIAALHQQFSELGTLERHVLATEGDDRDGLVKRVIAALDSNRFRLT